MSDVNTCDGEHYDCGYTTELTTGEKQDGFIHQTRNRKTSFMLGDTEIIANKVSRDFVLSYQGEWSSNPSFAVPNVVNGLIQYGPCGGSVKIDHSHSVTESYECVSTLLYFLDARYDNAVGLEISEKITFSEASDQMAGFKDEWGVSYYPKYVVINNILNKTLTYFIVINGVKSILKTVNSTNLLNGTNNPLILVHPQPGSLAIPWVNCDDIKNYGYYDYHAVGAGEGQDKIRQDGGDDYYFTDWMRMIGGLSFEQDQREAENRYFEYYLGDGAPASQSFSNPGIYTDDTPCCSIGVDAKGNVMYSALLGGEVFNFLTDGDLTTFDERITAGSKLFPMGII